MGKNSKIEIYKKKKKDNKKNYEKCQEAITIDTGPKTALSPKIEGKVKCVLSLI